MAHINTGLLVQSKSNEAISTRGLSVESSTLLNRLLEKILKADPRFIRQPEVKSRTGRADATLWKDIADGTFFPPVSIGARSVAWIEAEVSAWLEVCIWNARTTHHIDLKVLVAEVIAATRLQPP